MMTPDLPADPARHRSAAADDAGIEGSGGEGGEATELLASTLGRYCLALADLDVERVLAFYRDDAVVVDLIEHRVFSGPEQRRAWIEEWARGYRNLVLAQREILPAGNHVAVKWTLTGETASGETVCLRGVDIMVVDRQGRIRSQWGTFHRHPQPSEQPPVC